MNEQESPKRSLPQEKEIRSAGSDAPAAPVYFSVSVLKLIVMSICMMGIYELYWFYKNWTLIKERDKRDIKPFWRAFFAIFFCYQLFDEIRMRGFLDLNRSIAAGPLAAGWIIFTLLWRLPDPYWLLTYFAVIFLIPTQRLVNEINRVANPLYEENDHFTFWNIVAVVFGGIFFALILLDSFFPAA